MRFNQSEIFQSCALVIALEMREKIPQNMLLSNRLNVIKSIAFTSEYKIKYKYYWVELTQRNRKPVLVERWYL